METLIIIIKDIGIWSVPVLGTLIVSAFALGLWTRFVSKQKTTKNRLVKVLTTPLLFALPVSLLLVTILIGTDFAIVDINYGLINASSFNMMAIVSPGLSKLFSLQLSLGLLAVFSGCSLAIRGIFGLVSKNRNIKQVLPWVVAYGVCGILAWRFMIQTGQFWPLIGSMFLLACSTSMFPTSEEFNANLSQFGAALLGGIFLTSLLSSASAWDYIELFDAVQYSPADKKDGVMASGLQHHDGIAYLMMYFLAFIPSVILAFKLNTGKIQAFMSMIVIPLAIAVFFFPETKSAVTTMLEETAKLETIGKAEEIFQEGKEEFKKVFTVQNQPDLATELKTTHTKFSEAYSMIPTSKKYKAYVGYTTFYVNKDSNPKVAEKGLNMLLEVTGISSKQADYTNQNKTELADKVSWDDWHGADDYDKSYIPWVLLSRVYQEQGNNEQAISILSDLANTGFAPAVAELSLLEQHGVQTVVPKTVAPKPLRQDPKD